MGCWLYFMVKKTVFRGQLARWPGNMCGVGTAICVLDRAGWTQNTKSMGQEESCGDQRTRILRGLSNHEGDHKKLAEKVFNLVISSGEILINLTPDRKCFSPSPDCVFTQTTSTSISMVFSWDSEEKKSFNFRFWPISTCSGKRICNPPSLASRARPGWLIGDSAR